MKRHSTWVLIISLLTLNMWLAPEQSFAFGKRPNPTNPGGPPTVKDWTFLVFLNGNNNLDPYGAMDINEMEAVGSTDRVNVVVQWASLQAKNVRRLLVKRDSDPSKVTSPILENMGAVDMGDYRNLVEFVKWASVKYPAKNYFIDVWNHGSGWHRKSAVISPRDISYDDLTGNSISTEQLGVAMKESSVIIGKKVAIYGSDACLMSMAEVADEMADSVEIFVGSEEVEPAEGWPYDKLLERWNSRTEATPAVVAQYLTEEYVRSYSGGSQGSSEVTFSAFDLTKMANVNSAVKDLGAHLRTFDANDKKKILNAVSQTQFFTYRDYGDALDFLKQLEGTGLRLDSRLLGSVREAVAGFVIANVGTPAYSRATGVALWLPASKFSYDTYSTRYRALQFHLDTGWGDTMQALMN